MAKRYRRSVQRPAALVALGNAFYKGPRINYQIGAFSRANGGLQPSRRTAASLKEIANRKISGSRIFGIPATWYSWTPSGSGKIYQYTMPVTPNLWNGTWVTLGEGQAVAKANFKGTFFEAYSAQKFCVFLTPFFCSPNDVTASAEAGWTNNTDPKDYVLSHHTDVHALSETKVITSRPALSGMWYVRINTGSIFNNIVKEYIAKNNGLIRDTTKLNITPMEGYLETTIVAGSTNDIFYSPRMALEAVTTQADMI